MRPAENRAMSRERIVLPAVAGKKANGKMRRASPFKLTISCYNSLVQRALARGSIALCEGVRKVQTALEAGCPAKATFDVAQAGAMYHTVHGQIGPQ